MAIHWTKYIHSIYFDTSSLSMPNYSVWLLSFISPKQTSASLPGVSNQLPAWLRYMSRDTFLIFTLTYLTYSMVQSSSWEANYFAASHEFPRISRNPKVHYRTHKHPPAVSILGQPNPIHIPISHLLEIRPNIIHPSTPRSPQCSFFSSRYNIVGVL